jgi:hypothetical protein
MPGIVLHALAILIHSNNENYNQELGSIINPFAKKETEDKVDFKLLSYPPTQKYFGNKDLKR